MFSIFSTFSISDLVKGKTGNVAFLVASAVVSSDSKRLQVFSFFFLTGDLESYYKKTRPFHDCSGSYNLFSFRC